MKYTNDAEDACRVGEIELDGNYIKIARGKI